MDNKAIATLLHETADLLEIDGQDSFRVRSYRNAAEAIEALPQQISDLIQEPKKLLEVPGIGKGMQANLLMLFKDGKIEAHAELLKKYRPSMLELLKIQGLGPKTIALIWSAYQVSDLEGVEKLAREGKIRELPRMGEKHEAKLLKAIEDYRRIGGRFLLDKAEELAEKLTEYLLAVPGIEKVTPALRCGADAKRWEISISSSRARVALRMNRARTHSTSAALSGIDGSNRAGRKQSQLPASQRHAGGRAPAGSGVVWSGDAIFHRIEGSQRGATPTRTEDGLHAQRVQPGDARRREAGGAQN